MLGIVQIPSQAEGHNVDENISLLLSFVLFFICGRGKLCRNIIKNLNSQFYHFPDNVESVSHKEFTTVET